MCLRECGLPSAALQVVGGSEEVQGSQDLICQHTRGNHNEFKSQPKISITYYTPGPKTYLLVAKFDMFIRLFGGHVAPFARARMRTTAQFVLDNKQLSTVDRDGGPIAVIPVLLRFDWSRVL